MVMIANGKVARESDRPEVWYIENGARRWVPDPPTLETLGGWGRVELVYAPARIENPLGPMYPSAMAPQNWDDGSLLVAHPDPAVFVMEGGRRRWIPDPATFEHHGYDWGQIRQISSLEMNAIPRGPDMERYRPGPVSRYDVHTGSQFLGAGHYMETDAQLFVATGLVTGKTRTTTITWFGGFHGACLVMLEDEHGIPVVGGQSPLWRYGVDGTAIGRSDRTDAFDWSIDQAEAQRVRDMKVFHTWAPDTFQTMLERWKEAGRTVAELAESVGSIAKVVAAIAA